MNIRLTLKKWKALPLMVASVLGTSCDDGEGDSLNPVLISIDVPDGLLTGGGNAYIVASDAKGEILAFTELKDGEVNELRSDSYKESTFTLSLVSREVSSQYKDLYGSSYHGVKRGLSFVIDASNFEEFEEELEFTTQNFDNTASYYILSSNGDYDYIYPDFPDGYLYMAKSPTRVFITKYDLENQPVGFLFPATTYTGAQSPTINLAGTYASFQSETVTLSEQVYAGVAVFGRLAANDYQQQYSVSQVDDYASSLSIKYPGNTFPAYSSYSYVEGDNYYYEAYHKSQRSDFSLMTVNADVEINGQKVTYSVTGDGDIVSIDFDQEGTDFEYIDWDLYANVGSNQSVVVPKLPTEITNGFSSYSYSNWQADDEAVVLQIEGISSADEYVAGEFDGSLYNSRNAKYLYLYFGSGPARTAREAVTSEKKSSSNLANFKSRFENRKREK
jgi:hypothetical protein